MHRYRLLQLLQEQIRIPKNLRLIFRIRQKYGNSPS